MGNDGGSIPTRRELVKNAARIPNTTEVKAVQLESQTYAWTYCPLSQRPLALPIVSDCAGTLYNKDAVLEYLLPSDEPSVSTTKKTEHEEALATRMRSLRDVVEVKFQTEKDDSTRGAKFVCPITAKELGPQTKGVYLAPCGHAFAETAIKQVAGDICLQCGEHFESENILPILPVAKEDISRMAERIRRLKEAGLTHSLKKVPGGKKRKKHAINETSESTANGVIKDEPELQVTDKTKKLAAGTADLDGRGTATPQPKSGTATPSGGIKNAATASLTAKVLDEQEERNKRRKLGLNDNLKSLFSKGAANGAPQKNADFMTRGYSIPKKA